MFSFDCFCMVYAMLCWGQVAGAVLESLSVCIDDFMLAYSKAAAAVAHRTTQVYKYAGCYRRVNEHRIVCIVSHTHHITFTSRLMIQTRLTQIFINQQKYRKRE